jgi:ElaA protein
MPPATSPTPHGDVARGGFDDLSTDRLYDLLRLRSAVFVVEQDCPFLDLDGRDREPAAEHLWIDDADGLAGCLRLLDEGGGEWSIGRVVTRSDVRSHGVGAALVQAGLARLGELGCRRVRLGAQAHLARWYSRFGFTAAGPEYLEDGIPHVPMALDLGVRS